MSNPAQRYKEIGHLVNSFFEGKADKDGNHFKYPNRPKLTDNQIVTLAIWAYIEDIHSELNLYKRIKSDMPEIYRTLPDRSNFNRRRKRLHFLIDQFQASLVDELIGDEDTYIIDSMPLQICRYARAPRTKILKEDPLLEPSHGYKPIDRQYFFGFKLHLSISSKGLINQYVLSEAALHDVKMVQTLAGGLQDRSKILADKGYVSKSIQTSLFDTQQIKLITPSRKGMAANKEWNKTKRRARKRIETTFSQLADQFRIVLNYAKKIDGYLARMTSRIAALNCLQYFNVRNKRPMNHLRDAMSVI